MRGTLRPMQHLHQYVMAGRFTQKLVCVCVCVCVCVHAYTYMSVCVCVSSIVMYKMTVGKESAQKL